VGRKERCVSYGRERLLQGSFLAKEGKEEMSYYPQLEISYLSLRGKILAWS